MIGRRTLERQAGALEDWSGSGDVALRPVDRRPFDVADAGEVAAAVGEAGATTASAVSPDRSMVGSERRA